MKIVKAYAQHVSASGREEPKGYPVLFFTSEAERDEAAEMVEAMRWLSQNKESRLAYYDWYGASDWNVYDYADEVEASGDTPWQAILAAKRQAESEGDDD